MLFTHDATFYANKIKKLEYSVSELVEAALTNIEILNPKLNAVTHIQATEARNIAAHYDEQLIGLEFEEIKKFPPFYGVPILLKDLGQSEAGQPDSSGAHLMKDFIAKETNNFVQKILDAGFIIVGRTNVPEFGFKNESDSELFGSVHSPFSNDLNPGGSSGGAAAALKAGIVPIVTASDGGGSIRIPASFNGLIGLKTSRGRIPVGPGGYRGWQGASVHFALTKSVRDTWTLLKAMQVEQFDAPFVLPTIKEDTLLPLSRPLKLAYSFDSPIGGKVSTDAKNTVIRAKEALERFGHQLIEKTPQTDGIRAMQTYYKVNGVETAAMMESFENLFNRSMQLDDMETMSWALYRSGLKVSGVDYSKLLSYWDDLTAEMEAFFEEYDALILPSTNGPAFPHHHFKPSAQLTEKLENIDDFPAVEQQNLIWEMFSQSLDYTPFTQQQNLTGQPAISLPLYENEAGLPVGTQIWTRKGAEMLLLQIAQQLEAEGLLKASILPLY